MITIINHSQYRIRENNFRILKKEIQKIVKAVEEFYSLNQQKINIAFIKESEIADLCQLYFKEKKSTDVLSFPESPSPNTSNSSKKSTQNAPNEKISGNIAICLDVVFNYAIEDDRNLVKAFYETLLHGTLHLFGLEHDYHEESLEQVYQLQDEILSTLQLNEDIVNEIIEKFNSQE